MYWHTMDIFCDNDYNVMLYSYNITYGSTDFYCCSYGLYWSKL